MMVKPVLQPIGLLFKCLHISIYVVFPAGIIKTTLVERTIKTMPEMFGLGIDSMQKLTNFAVTQSIRQVAILSYPRKIKNKAAQSCAQPLKLAEHFSSSSND